jgi:hypothetical protein
MSQAARILEPDVIDRRRPDRTAEPVVVNPEAMEAAQAIAQQTFMATRDLSQAVTVGVLRALQVLAEAARRGARYATSTGRAIEGVHPGDVPVGLEKFLFHSGIELEGIGSLRAEEAFARALEAVNAARERRVLLRVKEHRGPDSHAAELAAEIANEVGQRIAARRQGKPSPEREQ